MRPNLSARTPEHRAPSGARPCLSRIRATGAAAAPRTDARTLASGTHRTRVSEMRLAGARAALRCPALVAARRAGRHAAVMREWGDEVRPGTG